MRRYSLLLFALLAMWMAGDHSLAARQAFDIENPLPGWTTTVPAIEQLKKPPTPTVEKPKTDGPTQTAPAAKCPACQALADRLKELQDELRDRRESFSDLEVRLGAQMAEDKKNNVEYTELQRERIDYAREQVNQSYIKDVARLDGEISRLSAELAACNLGCNTTSTATPTTQTGTTPAPTGTTDTQVGEKPKTDGPAPTAPAAKCPACQALAVLLKNLQDARPQIREVFALADHDLEIYDVSFKLAACNQSCNTTSTAGSIFTRPLLYVPILGGVAVLGGLLVAGGGGDSPTLSSSPTPTPIFTTPTPAPAPAPVTFTVTFPQATWTHPAGASTSTLCMFVVTTPAQQGAAYMVETGGPAVLPGQNVVSGLLNNNGQAAPRIGIGNLGTYTSIGTVTSTSGVRGTGTVTITVTSANNTCP